MRRSSQLDPHGRPAVVGAVDRDDLLPAAPAGRGIGGRGRQRHGHGEVVCLGGRVDEEAGCERGREQPHQPTGKLHRRLVQLAHAAAQGLGGQGGGDALVAVAKDHVLEIGLF